MAFVRQPRSVQAPTKSELIVNLKTAKALHISRFRQITGFSLSQEIATHAAKGAIELAKRAIEEALKAEEKRQGEPF